MRYYTKQKKNLTARVIKCTPTEAVQSPSLEIFKAQQGKALNNLVIWFNLEVSLALNEGLEQMMSGSPFQPKLLHDSVTL